MSTSRKNLSCFVPDEIEWGDFLPMNVQFKMRLETNIKLQITSNEGERLVPDDKLLEPEVHFMQFEATTVHYPISLAFFKVLWRNRSSQPINFQNWTFTDFDNFLKGNPFLEAEEKPN